MCSGSQCVQEAENRQGLREYFVQMKMIKLNLKWQVKFFQSKVGAVGGCEGQEDTLAFQIKELECTVMDI